MEQDDPKSANEPRVVELPVVGAAGELVLPVPDQWGGKPLWIAATYFQPQFQPISSTDYQLVAAATKLIRAGAESYDAVSDFAGNANAADTQRISRVDPGYPWHNTAEPTDVSGNGLSSPLDALRVLNELAVRFDDGKGVDLIDPPPVDRDFNLFDVSCDGKITLLDALRVLNFLASQSP